MSVDTEKTINLFDYPELLVGLRLASIRVSPAFLSGIFETGIHDAFEVEGGLPKDAELVHIRRHVVSGDLLLVFRSVEFAPIEAECIIHVLDPVFRRVISNNASSE